VSVTPNASLVGLQVYKGRLTRPHLRSAKSFTACHPPQPLPRAKSRPLSQFDQLIHRKSPSAGRPLRISIRPPCGQKLPPAPTLAISISHTRQQGERRDLPQPYGVSPLCSAVCHRFMPSVISHDSSTTAFLPPRRPKVEPRRHSTQ
jgi:hypothetical protein